MPNTYTQIHIHVVFTVRYRLSLIHESWKEDLYKYITGIVKSNGHKLLIINGIPDHVHLLIGMKPHQSLSNLMQHVKASSSKWINTKNFTHRKFSWQEGFGAFSIGISSLDNVLNYIKNQEEHHRKKSFIGEYRDLLDEFEVEYNERYIFKRVI